MTFTKAQAEFIHRELDIEVQDGTSSDLSEEIICEIQDALFDIEAYETNAAEGDELSERGQMAAAIVTAIGNS